MKRFDIGPSCFPALPDSNIPTVFINCRKYPFIGLIRVSLKVYETRNRNTLRTLVGKRVILAETGNGTPVAGCTAVIGEPLKITHRVIWEEVRRSACIDSGSSYDWKPDTKQKYIYPLYDVRTIAPYQITKGRRHGRVWMEFTPDETTPKKFT